MRHKLKKRIVSALVAIMLLMSAFGGISAFAEREYAANVSINGVAVDFQNEPYSKYDMVFVPLKEFCGYINLELIEKDGVYTINRMGNTIMFQTENMVVRINGENQLMKTSCTERGGVVYAPIELFSTGFKIPVEFSENFRSAEIKPNVYSLVIDEQHAAAVSAEAPDKDTLATGTTASDSLHYKPTEFPELEKSVYYMLDFSPFAKMNIEKVNFTVRNAINSNLSPSLGFVKTALWDKATINYNNRPEEIKEQSIASKTLSSSTYKQNQKNWADMSFDITSLAKGAMSEGGVLSLKALGAPYKNQANAKSVQVYIKGVNTVNAPYAQITVSENYNFPVKEIVRQTDIDRNTFTKLNFLTKLGVFKVGEEFPSDLTTGVTRREFVTYAIRLMNDFEYNENAVQIFSDVAPGSASYGEIMDSAALGLISSGEGMAFRPDDIITYDEALTIIGRMLGYGIYAEKNGGFAQGFVSAAIKNDLLDSVRSHEGKIGFDSIFNLFFNALDSPMFETSVYYSSGNEEYIFNPNVTLLSEYWDLRKVEGTVEGNEYTNINYTIAGTSGQLVIEGNKYNIGNPEYNSLLGYEVEGYYDKDNNILYLGADKPKNDTDVIDLHSVTNVTKGGAINFTYEDKNGKNNTDSITSSDKIIYNGKSINFSQITPKLLDKETGSITYLNDTIVIITAYTTVVVYDVDEEEEVITDKYAPYDNTLRLKNTDYYVFRDENGDGIEIEKLSANDVISAAVSLDKKLIVGEVSKSKLTGKIASVTDENEIEVNGHLYETVGENLSWLNDVKKLGAEGTLLLDAFGYVAGFEAGKPTENIFGYVLTHGNCGSGINPKLQLGLITTESEEMVAYTLAEKVVIDGVSCKTHDTILKALGDSDGIGSTADVKKQGIVFSLNADREISKIDTPEFNDKKELIETSLHTRYSSATKLYYKSLSGRLGDLFYWDRDTALNVLVPTDETDLDEYQYFRSGLTNDLEYQAEVYSVGKEHPNADIVVIRGASTSSGVGGTISVAGKRVFVLNEDGDYDEKLYYYTASEKASTAIIPDDFFTDTDIKESYKNDLRNLKPGDIIRVGKDFNGKLKAITRYYDYNNESFIAFSNENKFNDDERIYGGYATNKYSSFVRFTSDKSLLDDVASFEAASEDKFRWIDLKMNGNYNKVFKYEVEQGNIIMENATEADVVDYKHVPYAPSGLMLQVRYGQEIYAAYIVNVKKPDNTGIYKVTFDPGENASGTMPDKQVDTTVLLPPNGFLHNDPAYGFDCWTYNGQDYSEGETVSVTGDTTFTAKWKWVGIQYDVTYNGNGADSGTVAGTRALEGSNITLAENPSDTGFKKANYKFAGWEYDGVTYQGGDTFPMPMPGKAVEFKAKWVLCWDGSKSEPAKNGDVYQISNGAELAWFASHVNEGYTTASAELTKDIVLNLENQYDTEWTAIGNSSDNAYKGTFDGKGFTIKGLYNKSGAGSYTGGLFGRIGSGGTVKNVNIAYGKLISQYATNTNLSGIGMIAGYVNGGTIYGCIVEGTITNDGAGTFVNGCAGIAADVRGASKIERCISRVNITSDGSETPATSGDNLGIGGIAAKIQGTTEIYQCGNEGTINLPGYIKVGGIAGAQYKDGSGNIAKVNQCYNTGNITAKYNVAGIVGATGTNVTLAEPNYNRGNITVAHTSGRGAGLWTDAYQATGGGSYTTGIVNMPNVTDSVNRDRSGLAYAPKNNSKKAFKEYIYVIPANNPTTALSHAIKVDTAGNNYTVSGTDMTNEADMSKWVEKLNGWAGTGVYTIDASLNEGYPIFTWQK